MPTNIEELRQYMEVLESRIKELEDKKQQEPIKTEQKEIVRSFDVLRVFKLLASLPVYTVARTGTPQHGEIYITDIGGTRKINVYISGTNYSATIT